MPRTDVITVFSNEAIAKNASVVSGLIPLSKFGPNSRFWGDFTASGGGRTSIRAFYGDSPSDTFYEPSNASLCFASFLGGAGNASRDRFPLSIMGAQWIKFKAKENNASHTVFSMGLIVSQD